MQPSSTVEKKYDLAGKVIGLAMIAHTKLNAGYLESVYHQALIKELRKANISFESERPIHVYYDDEIIGSFQADLIIENALIVEIKAVHSLCTAHEVQLVNYLTATKINEGLLLNFGSLRLEYKKKFRLYQKKEKIIL